MLLGGWEEGLKDFFGQNDDAVALLGGKGGFVYGTTCWHRAAAAAATQQSTGLFLG